MTIFLSPVWRVIAAVAGIAVFALVFTYTGDADLWSAIGSGMGTALVCLIGAHLYESGAPDGDA